VYEDECVMRVGDLVQRVPITLPPDGTIRQAAQLMESNGVGSIAVVDGQRLVGMVTDRDIVRRAVARGLASDARIDGIMSAPVVTIDADADLRHAFDILHGHAVRRLAVVRDGAVVGILSVDDLLVCLSSDLANLARPVTAELLFAHRDPPLPTTA
jgi:CBS domain-containing protein